MWGFATGEDPREDSDNKQPPGQGLRKGY